MTMPSIKVTRSNVIKSVMFIAVVAVVVLFWDSIQQIDIQELVGQSENRWSTVWIIIGLFISKSVLFFLPVKLINISSGMVFPILIAVIINLVGTFIEITLTYYYGKWLGRDAVIKWTSKNEKLQRLMERHSSNEFSGIFLARLAPVVVEPVSLLLGAMGTGYWRYIAASMFGLFPKVVFFIMLGTLIVQPFSVYTIVVFLVSTVLWLLLVIYYRKKGMVSLKY